jgi:hypothetical protein
MTLRQVLDRLKPALVPTNRYINPAVVHGDGYFSAYNGAVYARLPAELDLPPFHCGSLKLDKVVGAESRLSVGGERLTLIDGRAKFSLARLADDQTVDLPLVEGEPHLITPTLVEQAQRIANFASTNAVHPWANCVVATRDQLLATNNVAMAMISMEVGVDMTWPLGLVERLQGGQQMRANDRMVSLTEEDGLVLQYHRLSAEAPAQMLKLAKTLVICDRGLNDFADILRKLDNIEAQTMTMTKGEIRLTASDGDEGSHPFELDWDDGVEFKTSMEAARLLARFGTSVDERDCPGKLYFNGPGIVGVLAGRSG